MNKTGVAVLSALLTAGLGVGALAIMKQIPATSNMLSTAFGERPNIEIKEETPSTDVNSILEKQGYIAVNYITEDGIISNLQKKGSACEFYAKPKKDGYSCIGWSTTADGKNMVGNLDKSCDLYPVFATGEFSFRVYIMGGHTTYNSVSNLKCNRITSNGDGYSYGVACLSKSRDSMDFVTEIEDGGEYYPIYYFTTTNTLMTMDEADRYIDYLNYGENGFKQATVHYVMKGTITDEIRKFDQNENIRVGSDSYYLGGYSTSSSSVENMIESNKDMVENGEYYLVYQCYVSGVGTQYFSYDYVNSLFDVFISVGNNTSLSIKYSQLSNYETTVKIDNVEFRFVGWSTSSSEVNIVEQTDIINQKIKNVYAVYVRSDNNEIYTMDKYTELRNDYIIRVYAYDGQHISVHFLEAYEKDVTISGTLYEFVGWSESSTSTEIIEDMETVEKNDFIYCVYKNTVTEELLTYTQIYNLYRNQ